MRVQDVLIGLRVRRASNTFVGESGLGSPPGAPFRGRRIGVIIDGPHKSGRSSHHHVIVQWESDNPCDALRETILVQRLTALPLSEQPPSIFQKSPEDQEP